MRAIRAFWKGNIELGLVQIPVELISAEDRKEEFDFDLLDGHDMHRVHYKRVNEKTGKEVEWKDVVRGYAYKKGKYLVITDEDFEEARRKANPQIAIDRFVDPMDIDPQYYDQPYYVRPSKGGEKGYVLLRNGLTESGLVAIVKVIMRTKEHIASIGVLNDALVLNTLRYEHTLRSPKEIGLKGVSREKPKPKEVKMMKIVINQFKGKWDPKNYHEEYHERLREIIKEKVKLGGERENEILETPEPTNVTSLMDLLKESVEERKHRKQKRPSRLKRAA